MRRAHVVVVRLAERDDDVQAIHRAALEQHDHFLFAGDAVAAMARCRNEGMAEPCRAWRCRRFSGNMRRDIVACVCSSCFGSSALKFWCA